MVSRSRAGSRLAAVPARTYRSGPAGARSPCSPPHRCPTAPSWWRPRGRRRTTGGPAGGVAQRRDRREQNRTVRAVEQREAAGAQTVPDAGVDGVDHHQQCRFVDEAGRAACAGRRGENDVGGELRGRQRRLQAGRAERLRSPAWPGERPISNRRVETGGSHAATVCRPQSTPVDAKASEYEYRTPHRGTAQVGGDARERPSRGTCPVKIPAWVPYTGPQTDGFGFFRSARRKGSSAAPCLAARTF